MLLITQVFNIEGYKRNKFYLSKLVRDYDPLFIFLQETWLPHHEINLLINDFKDYNFHTTTADMFEYTEDILMKSGPTWHGTTVGWKRKIDDYVTKLPVVCERFCAVR